MSSPIAQQHYFGCGFACLAKLLNLTYQETFDLIENGENKAKNSGLLCKELMQILQQNGYANSHYKYIKPHLKNDILKDGTIVYIKKEKNYPVGHYLIRHNGQWMDPWINWLDNQDHTQAKAGYRDDLPTRPIYAIFPE